MASNTGLADPEKVHAATVMEQIREDHSDEKKSYVDEVTEVPSVEYGEDESPQDYGTDDPFPVDPNAPVEQQFTFRAVFVGCALGAVISASNVYLGLKTGWTFGASMFGSIFGFAILKPMSKALPERFGGGYFGPKENVCLQSASTAAGSLGLLFSSGFPAAYQLGLLGESPSADFGRIITFTICCAYVGIFFTMPLRRLYILKLKLTFPSSVATAYTIRSLHVGTRAAAIARKKTVALAVSFAISIIWRVTSEYAPGIMWDWHWSWWFYRAGWKWIICAESWGWIWEWTPAFIGCGLLVPMNSSVSFVGGAALAWAIIGPALVTTGRAFGKAYSDAYPGYWDYSNMVLDDPVHAPSPEYWMIWPGCMLLLTASVAEIAANYRTIATAFSVMLSPLVERIRPGKARVFDKEDGFYDPVPEDEQTPWWMWVGGLIASTIMTMCVMKYQFGQNAGITLLSIIFAFIFSLVGAECVGRVSVNPVTTLGNFSQLIFGGISKGSGMPAAQNQLNNGLTGMITLAAAEQCSDMLGDLKVTHLLGASPRVQLYSQCCGALVSIFLSAAMYVVFSTAYPCINTLSSSKCTFPAPDVSAWRAVSLAVSEPSLPIPLSSGITALVLGGLVIVSTAVKYRFFAPETHKYFPNWNAVGIAMVLGPTNTYPVAMMFGSLIAFLWRRRFPASWLMYGYAIAAGMIAGEGLGGIVNAALEIGKVSGSLYGTSVGCPMNEYCG
ncbi:OPT oligopeptide transporter [Wolfiporia cocos MD-104 SS10]|uniref:OPT oligopeptide transporter n=1 Tax=Wolfiporia cocos (strain MD-104) TaxID=742152 RepID=A0A2H3JQB0_WOLCO|nr:OPT oligopeptide transporter [Wolfiporia cocos MD-104 SS10]